MNLIEIVVPEVISATPLDGNTRRQAFLYLFADIRNGGVGLRLNQVTPIDNYRGICVGDGGSSSSKYR